MFSKEQNADSNKKNNSKNEIRDLNKILIPSFHKKSSLIYAQKFCRQVLKDFTKFSLSIDPAPIPKNIWWKFNLNSNQEDLDIILQWITLKYLTIINQIFGSDQINYNWYLIIKFYFTSSNKLIFIMFSFFNCYKSSYLIHTCHFWCILINAIMIFEINF